MPRKRKRKPFRSWGKPLEFGKWVKPEIHQHSLVNVNEETAAGTFVKAVCTGDGCPYIESLDFIPREQANG